MRRYELDLCRVLACLMVVMIHLSGSGWHIDPATGAWRVYNLIHAAVRPGIPLFFMITGALFLSRDTLDVGRLVRRNIPRLLAVYLCWDLLYELATQAVSAPYHSVGEFLMGMTYGHYHLWFLPAMLLIYLALPLLHGAVHGRAVPLPFLLAVFGLIFVKATLLLVPDPPLALTQVLGKLDLSNLKYLVYVLLGWWLSRRQWGPRARWGCAAGFLACVALMAYGNRQLSLALGEPTGWFNDYFGLPILLASCCVFCFCLTFRGAALPSPAAGALRELSGCTLGVYLLHPFVLESLGRMEITVNDYSPFVGLPLLFALIVVPCFAVIFLIRRIPGLRKIV